MEKERDEHDLGGGVLKSGNSAALNEWTTKASIGKKAWQGMHQRDARLLIPLPTQSPHNPKCSLALLQLQAAVMGTHHFHPSQTLQERAGKGKRKKKEIFIKGKATKSCIAILMETKDSFCPSLQFTERGASLKLKQGQRPSAMGRLPCLPLCCLICQSIPLSFPPKPTTYVVCPDCLPCVLLSTRRE